MSATVVGTVTELEGSVVVMREGAEMQLTLGDAIMSNDIVTAGEGGRAVIGVQNVFGEPIGNLMLTPGGSVAAMVSSEGESVAINFEALSQDGVVLSDIDPDYADTLTLQGGTTTSGGMFGLFDGASDFTMGEGVAAGAATLIGVGLVASSSGGGDSPASSVNSAGTQTDDGNTTNDGTADGPTGTPLDGVFGGGDTGSDGPTGTPLDAVLGPLADAAGGGGDTGSDGPTGTPLDAVLGPLADAAGGGGDTGTDGPTGTPLDAVLGPVADAAGGGGDTGSDGPTGTPLDAVLGPVADAAGGDGSTAGTTGTPLDAVVDPVFDGLNSTPLNVVSEPLQDGVSTVFETLTSASPASIGSLPSADDLPDPGSLPV